MQLNEGQVNTIVYRSDVKSETTVRKIIPTSVPADVVRAIDIGQLSEADQAEMIKLYANYVDYRTTQLNKIFNFTDYVSHTTGKEIEPKWRAFKVSGIKLKT